MAIKVYSFGHKKRDLLCVINRTDESCRLPEWHLSLVTFKYSAPCRGVFPKALPSVSVVEALGLSVSTDKSTLLIKAGFGMRSGTRWGKRLSQHRRSDIPRRKCLHGTPDLSPRATATRENHFKPGIRPLAYWRYFNTSRRINGTLVLHTLNDKSNKAPQYTSGILMLEWNAGNFRVTLRHHIVGEFKIIIAHVISK